MRFIGSVGKSDRLARNDPHTPERDTDKVHVPASGEYCARHSLSDKADGHVNEVSGSDHRDDASHNGDDAKSAGPRDEVDAARRICVGRTEMTMPEIMPREPSWSRRASWPPRAWGLPRRPDRVRAGAANGAARLRVTGPDTAAAGHAVALLGARNPGWGAAGSQAGAGPAEAGGVLGLFMSYQAGS